MKVDEEIAIRCDARLPPKDAERALTHVQVLRAQAYDVIQGAQHYCKVWQSVNNLRSRIHNFGEGHDPR